MDKNYRIKKSDLFSNDKKEFYSSYIFEYYNTITNEWRECKNWNSRAILKYLLLNSCVELYCEYKFNMPLLVKHYANIAF